MLFELAESVDRQDVCGTEHLRAAPTLLLVVHLTGAHLEIKNMPWLSLRGGSGPPQPFPRDHGTGRGIVVVQFEVVRQESTFRGFPIGELDHHRSAATPGSYLPEAAAAVACRSHVLGKALVQEREN